MCDEAKIHGLCLRYADPTFRSAHLSKNTSGGFPDVSVCCMIESRSRNASMPFPSFSFNREHVISEDSKRRKVIRCFFLRVVANVPQGLSSLPYEVISQTETLCETRDVSRVHECGSENPGLDYNRVKRGVVVDLVNERQVR